MSRLASEDVEGFAGAWFMFQVEICVWGMFVYVIHSLMVSVAVDNLMEAD